LEKRQVEVRISVYGYAGVYLGRGIWNFEAKRFRCFPEKAPYGQRTRLMKRRRRISNLVQYSVPPMNFTSEIGVVKEQMAPCFPIRLLRRCGQLVSHVLLNNILQQIGGPEPTNF
jgi:hypothetical protein